jgi:putative tryptophan/tyrosine transport system substrate-binding protein
MRGVPGDPPHHPGMDRRRFLLTSLAGALAAPVQAASQQARMKATVGILSPFDRASSLPAEEAFRRGLADHGYVESQNIALVYRWADGRADLLAPLAQDLLSRKVDLAPIGK